MTKIECPICHAKTFDYVSYSEDPYGTIEQHGHCHRCGYIVEQAYSGVLEAFYDVKIGYKHPTLGYIPRDVERHKRIRRKLGIKNIEVNPEWVYYI